MSYNSPFFDFFDNINDEVDYFNRFLNDVGYAPKRERLAVTGNPQDNNQVATRGANSSAVSHPQRRYFGDLDNWFDNDFSLFPTSFQTPKPFGVPVDILDHDANYELKVTVPGVKAKKDINLEYHQNKNQLIVTGEVPAQVTEKNKNNVKVHESASGKFKRVITLPEHPGIDADKIKADYSSGVLTLTVPKLKPTAFDKDNVQKIEISSQESWGE
ncbi:chaperone protein HSP26 KNAG_0H01120 [Huiozyma naganishii CBS 8797]|uniref:SHSP domain-containing protein n=1 Tax=Huiozyma naganishii (strain ATCC MYA-139 / BCRC 22969 / CBS 8797 / KCTC 17520 / NBRC 10181 / NCYC 3082 / Yp74L-3) TaxID=1071383 RepID=J7R9J4_HUIN7|nr:hypothetical protein KNAG_0H01120 [Kazachstania naganishii CBS 8797]CCK71525.1 hypothetical protein KNAG_0H01120 [Kazachstania naganishii CBS 8797]